MPEEIYSDKSRLGALLFPFLPGGGDLLLAGFLFFLRHPVAVIEHFAFSLHLFGEFLLLRDVTIQ